jgi:uncharacterized protein
MFNIPANATRLRNIPERAHANILEFGRRSRKGISQIPASARRIICILPVVMMAAAGGKTMVVAEQAGDAGQSCRKYLPNIGRVVEAPCEELVDAQAPEHACDRLAGKEFVKLIELIHGAEAVRACRAAVEIYPETRRFKFQLARALHSSGTYGEALQLYRPLAEAGDSDAMSNLGLMYADGRGVAKDEAEAVRLFRQAAEKGVPDAMSSLGTMYADGRGVKQDDAEAVRLYRQAAQEGEPGAMSNLGIMYEQGHGVAKDEAEAVRLYRQAAEKGYPAAMSNIGAMYDDGRGVKKDEFEAARWIFSAIEKGDEWSINEMTTNAAAWSVGFRQELQRRLREGGVYSGAIDSEFGPAVKGAIAALAARAKQQ